MRRFVFFLFLGISIAIQAQKEVVQILKAPEVSESLMKLYLAPFAKMTNKHMNSGWYHSAKTDRFLGFDLSLSMTISSVPSTERGFYLLEIDDFDEFYTKIPLSPSIAPNVSGVSNTLPDIKNRISGYQFQLPNGSDLQNTSIPLISFGIGLPFHTQLNLRYLPKVDLGDIGDVTQYGVSVTHSIKEYIPAFRKVPALSLSVWGGVSNQSNEIGIDYLSYSDSKQILSGKAFSYSGKVLIGWDVHFLSAYIGAGYGITKVDYALKGNYLVGDPTLQITEKDPLSVRYNFNQIEYNFGLNAKISFMDVFVEFSPSDYHTVNFGVGYSFR